METGNNTSSILLPAASTALAAISTSNGTYLFYQGDTGQISYTIKGVNGWTSDGTMALNIEAKNATPLAAAYWNDGHDQVCTYVFRSTISSTFSNTVNMQIRLFYVAPNSSIQEHAYDGGRESWNPGYLTSDPETVQGTALTAHQSSQLATTLDSSNTELRLYFQAPNGDVQELYYNLNKTETWSVLETPNFTDSLKNLKITPLNGTGLAAVAFPDNQFRVYLQEGRKKLLVEMAYVVRNNKPSWANR